MRAFIHLTAGGALILPLAWLQIDADPRQAVNTLALPAAAIWLVVRGDRAVWWAAVTVTVLSLCGPGQSDPLLNRVTHLVATVPVALLALAAFRSMNVTWAVVVLVALGVEAGEWLIAPPEAADLVRRSADTSLDVISGLLAVPVAGWMSARAAGAQPPPEQRENR